MRVRLNGGTPYEELGIEVRIHFFIMIFDGI